MTQDGVTILDWLIGNRGGHVVEHAAVVIARERIIELLRTGALIRILRQRPQQYRNCRRNPLAGGTLIGPESAAELLERVVVQVRGHHIE